MTVIQSKGVLAVANTRDPRLADWVNRSEGVVQYVGANAPSVSYYGMYQTQPWVRTCVDTIATGVSMLPCKVFERVADDDRRRVGKDDPGGTLAQLIANPYPMGSTMDFWEYIAASVEVHNNAVAVISRPKVGAPPDMIVPLDWRYFRYDKARGIYEYRYPGEQVHRFRREEFVHWSFWRGDSPLKALARSLQLDEAAVRHSTLSFEKGIKPGGALSFPEARLRPQQKQMLKEQLTAEHSGVDNAFRVMVLTGGAQWLPFGQSANDAQMVELRKASREEVAAVYRLPPPMIGILDDATYSNIETQLRMLYKISLASRIKKLEETLRVQLVEREPAWNGLYVEFDVDAVLRGDPTERADAYVKLLQSGFPLNFIMALENQPKVKGPMGDTSWVPANLQAVTEAGVTPAAAGDGALERLVSDAVSAALSAQD